MSMRVCYLDCHEPGLCCYLAIYIETYYVHYSCFTSICDLLTDSHVELIIVTAEKSSSPTDNVSENLCLRERVLLCFQFSQSKTLFVQAIDTL
jgi:hypothetical protein